MGSRLGGCGGLYYGSVRCDPGWAPLGWEGVAGLYYGSVRCDPGWAPRGVVSDAQLHLPRHCGHPAAAVRRMEPGFLLGLRAAATLC